jgi:DNA-binding response OmpR family regulator/tetratricopeptide (TPR) repeat protein
VRPVPQSLPPVLRLQAGALDPRTGVLRVDGERVELGRTGTAVLRILTRRLGEVVSADELCAALWPGRPGRERALSVAVHRLRAKLELDPLHPVHLRTVRGEGYVLEPLPHDPTPTPRPCLPLQGRSGPAPVAASTLIRLRDGTVDLAAGVVRRGGEAVELGSAELALVRALVAAGDPVPREILKARVLGYRSATRTRAVDAAVARLRRKLEADPAAPVHLLTVRGRGIQLVPAPPPANRRFAWERPMVGRAAELVGVQRLLVEGARLVTVTGPPGVGKSRIAVTAADRLFGPSAVPVDVRRGDLVPSVGAAFEVPGGGDADPSAARIGSALAHRGRVALVLDDADELGPADFARVRRWLEAAPELVVVVTSQRRTGVAGEAVFELAPLDPDDALALYEVRAADVGVALRGPAHREAVAALIAAHDHLPLAIELLAAGADVAGVEASDAAREGPLAKALARSWGSLSPAERTALAQATVFAAPFTADAAARVLDDPASLAGLRRVSLLRTIHGPDGTVRHDLLRTVRRYARDRGDPRAVAVATQRHTAWGVEEARAELLAAIVAGPPPPDQDRCAELLAILERDPPLEVRADVVVGLRHWYRHADLGALRRELAGLSARSDALSHDQRALLGLLELYESGDDIDPERYAALADGATDAGIAAGVRFLLGRALASAGRDADAAHLADGLVGSAIARHRGHGLLLLGVLAVARCDYAAAHRHLEEATAILRDRGSQEELAAALDGLSVALRERGRIDDAEAALEEALWRVNRGPIADGARVKRGLLALLRLEPERARQEFARVLAASARRGGGSEEVDALLGDGLAHLDLGNRLAMEARLAAAEQLPLPAGYEAEIVAARAVAAADAGEPEGRRALEGLLGDPRPMSGASAALALAWVQLAEGSAAGARTTAASGRERLAGTGARLLIEQLRATEAIAAARAGDAEVAVALLAGAPFGGTSIVTALQQVARLEAALARGDRSAQPGLTAVLAMAPRSVALRLVLGAGRR